MFSAHNSIASLARQSALSSGGGGGGGGIWQQQIQSPRRSAARPCPTSLTAHHGLPSRPVFFVNLCLRASGLKQDGANCWTSLSRTVSSEQRLFPSCRPSPSQVAGEQKYHPECFTCLNCRTFIGDGDTYALVERSKLYW